MKTKRFDKQRYIKRRDKKLAVTLRGKEAIAAYVFLIPFLIGLFGFFLPTIVQSIRFSLSDMSVGANGYELTKAAEGGFAHFKRALLVDPNFNRELLISVRDMFVQVPLILVFSFFVANLLNQKFKGRALARSIFFFPVILTSGVILDVEKADLLINMINGQDMSAVQNQASAMLNVGSLLLRYTELPVSIVMYLTQAVTTIYDVAISSGVQILIFLAGLQSISPSLFEASMIEGATGWENFWKITFPMISPLILVNSLYTIIDSFTKPSNEMMTKIQDTIFSSVQYGYGSAMAWIYFASIILIIAVVGGIVSKRVVYTE